jgi:hypothetical protein
VSLQPVDSDASLSETLARVRAALTGERVTLQELLVLIGEQGLLLFVMFLMVPFLLPVSIPGVSTVFSVVVVLVGAGIASNRLPWLPQRLLARSVPVDSLLPALDRAVVLMHRIDRVIRPRLLVLTHGATLNRINGIMLVLGGVLLLFPLGLVPFSNTLPGLAVLLLAAGLLQRDGIFVLLGYLMLALTVCYFAALAWAVFVIGANLQDLAEPAAWFRAGA